MDILTFGTSHSSAEPHTFGLHNYTEDCVRRPWIKAVVSV